MPSLLTIAGPDGAGTASVVDGLSARLSRSGPERQNSRQIARFLRRSRPRTRADDPRDQTPHGRWRSIATVALFYLEWVLAAALRWSPGRRRGRWTIIEHGWWSLMVDPQRYRLQPLPSLVEALGRARPAKGQVFVLDAPAEALLRHRPDLSVDEVTRQMETWRRLGDRHREITLIRGGRPIEEMVEDIVREALARPRGENGRTRPTSTDDHVADGDDPSPIRTGTRPTERWVHLWTNAHDWYIPTRASTATTSSLFIHHPMRLRSQLAWRGAGLVAATGALRLLPSCDVPGVHDLIRPYIPSGGTAVISSRRNGSRSMALTIDAAGRPQAIIKLAEDPRSRARLQAELASLARFGPLLSAPLLAPTVRHVEPGLVVMDAVHWQCRHNPWRLDLELARAQGRFYAQGEDPTNATGLAHGDFAPWNLLRTEDGWCLIDWEDAEDGRPPFDDIFHYVVQGYTFLGRPHLHDILDGLDLEGPVGELFAAYADGASLDPGSIRLPELFAEYLERSQLRYPGGREHLLAIIATRNQRDRRRTP